MSILIGVLFIINGLLGVFYPGFFYKKNKLTPEQIARNNRIWNRCGIVLIVVGIANLVITLL
jgi:uncharacterized protein YjeT (DUF2065 family)